MATIEPYQPPRDATAFPLRLDVNGATYVLAQGDGHQVDEFGYRQTLQHPIGPVVSGVQYARTAQGYRPLHEAQAQGYMSPAPYHVDPGHPPWLRNHYTRGTGILIGASAIGVVLFIAAAALYAIVTWALANLMAIGGAIILIFVGLMILLGGITKARHGHKPGR